MAPAPYVRPLQAVAAATLAAATVAAGLALAASSAAASPTYQLLPGSTARVQTWAVSNPDPVGYRSCVLQVQSIRNPWTPEKISYTFALPSGTSRRLVYRFYPPPGVEPYVQSNLSCG